MAHAAGSGTLTCAISAGQFANPRTGWLIYQSDTGWNLRMYDNKGTATSVNITGGGAPVAGHHSPLFKIDPEPSVRLGIEAMTAAARAWIIG